MKRNTTLATVGGIVGIALLVFVFKLAAKPHNPHYASYEDCILQNMKETQSETAAKYAAGACRKLFPPPVFSYEEAFPETTKLAQTQNHSK